MAREPTSVPTDYRRAAVALVSPEVRFTKAAEVLSPNGSLAVFGHVPVGLPTELLAQFKDIYLRRTGEWAPPPEAWYLPTGPFKGWFMNQGYSGRSSTESIRGSGNARH